VAAAPAFVRDECDFDVTFVLRWGKYGLVLKLGQGKKKGKEEGREGKGEEDESGE